ncbi:Sister chromatid cohesion protein PDS5-like B-B [Holothuria leucospilota]|uniref:Sister chromatid cohesion protein PDS5-like B-B n=1 Tax=Holothuria leucospilota TaxID=206669 RepID=A0A9Q1GZ31_HOLLE|nr:Sister chromatid cohesion protein PDS5-like B-B [Holothuria leucospilota]
MTRSKSHRSVLQITYPTGVKEITQDLPKDELVRRLKMLARSLQDMEQEDDNNQYESLALHITDNFFLKHSSKDVRLLVACCVADVFRIFAPEAPFRTASQLKTIFKFLCEQLWDLENTTSPSWKRYFYLLENLAMVKSFNICMELEDSNEIFIRLFTIFFSIVNKNHPPKVRGFMLDVMCPLISENDSVSPDLLEVILKNLVDSKKVENPFANILARDLIKRTATSIEPAMQSYFNNALVLGKASDSELSKHTYELIYQLNLISNNLLLAVLPQLEFKLKTSEEKERLAVTKLLGRMFSDKDSDLASNNKPLWNCFLGRFSDIATVIRIECVKFVPLLITSHPYLAEDLADRLRERVHDVEDDVRGDAVQALVDTAKKDITSVTDEMLQLIKERTLDKKWKIRKEAILGLAHIYKKWCYTEDVSVKDKERLMWMKDKILHSYYLPDLEDKLLVERIFTMNLVPYTLEVSERMQRFLELFVTVDEHSVKAIVELIKCQHIVRTHVRDLLEIIKGQTDGDQSKVVFSKIISIGKCLPESTKTQEHLKKMVKSLKEDQALLSFMKVVLSPDVTCKKAAHAVGEIMKRFSSQKATLLYNTVKTLMERIAPLIQDAAATREFLSLLVAYVDGKGKEVKGQENKEIIRKGLRLMQTLAHVYPYTFNSEESFNHLITMIKNEDIPNLSDTALQTLTQVGAGFEEHFPKAAKELHPVLTNFALMASPKQAKHSIRCINCVFSTTKKEIFDNIFQKSQQSLSLEHEHYFTALTTVAHLAHLAPEQFLGPMKTVIAGTIVKGILMQDRTEGSKSKGIWCHDDQLCEETQGKLLAIKVLVHWLLGLGRNISGSVISTIRLLTTMLKNEGDLMERKKIGRADMSRLRLAAGCALLKLAQVPAFAEFISLEQFQLIALLINDECFQVREKFAEKLNQGLISLRLPLSYMSILSLCIKDPVKENHKKASTYIKQCVAVRRQYLKQHNLTGVAMLAILPEYVIPHAVHLLSHDPDFVTPKDLEALNDIKECLWFIMEPLAVKPESCSFIRKMLETIKQMKDAQAVEDKTTANKKLYAVCEVALGLLTTKLPGVAIKDHPGDILLPARLFVKPKKPFNPRDSYLPKKLQQEFSQAEAKETQQKEKEDKSLEKKKTGKGAAGKKKTESGDENQSPLEKKEKKSAKVEKAEEKKEAKSNRKVLTQKEVNDMNSTKRSLRGKAQSPQKKSSLPRKQTSSPEKGLSSPETAVKSPKPKTKQTLMSKYVTTKSKSSDETSSPSPQKSPTKRASSVSSPDSSPPKKRRGAVSAKPSTDSEESQKSSPSKTTTKGKGMKELLGKNNKKDKEKTMVKSKKVASIKRVTKASPKKEIASPKKRRASSPLKSPPEKRSKKSSTDESPKKVTKKPASKKDTPKASESPTKTSPAKVSPKKKTPVPAPSGSKRLRQTPKTGQVAKKASPSPSPKKSPIKTATRKSSPSPARSTRSASTGQRGRPPTRAKKVSPPPAKKDSSIPAKKVSPSPAKRDISSRAKKGSSQPAKKVSSPPAKKVSPPPAKRDSSSLARRGSSQLAKKVSAPPAKRDSSSLARKVSSPPAKKVSPPPAKRDSSRLAKKVSSPLAKKVSPPSAKKNSSSPAKKVTSPPAKKVSPLPAKSKQQTKKQKKAPSKSPASSPPSSPAKSPKAAAAPKNAKPLQRGKKEPSRESRSATRSQKSLSSPTESSPVPSPQRKKPPATKKAVKAPAKNTRATRGRTVSPPKGSPSGAMPSRASRSPAKKTVASPKKPSPSPPKKVPVSPPKSLKSPPKVRRAASKKAVAPKVSPPKKVVKKTKSPVKKPVTTKNRSIGKTPTRDKVKRKLVESDSDAKSSPARSIRSSSSSLKSSPVKLSSSNKPSPVKSSSSTKSSPIKSSSSTKSSPVKSSSSTKSSPVKSSSSTKSSPVKTSSSTKSSPVKSSSTKSSPVKSTSPKKNVRQASNL